SGYNHRYISWMCVPLAALLAAGATLSVKRPLRLLATGALLAFSLYATGNLLLNPRYTKVDFGRVRALLEKRFDRPAILSSPDYFAEAVVYSFAEQGVVAIATGHPGEGADQQRQDWLAAFRVINDSPGGDPDYAIVLQWFPKDDGRYELQQELLRMLEAEYVGRPCTGVVVYRGSRAKLRSAIGAMQSPGGGQTAPG
ncbi:MAG: hypothetical protein KDA37_13110, partial [Planctomycetales bacterium]|nr:hypothetical protein [Planctomycetales bacterium]